MLDAARRTAAITFAVVATLGSVVACSRVPADTPSSAPRVITAAGPWAQDFDDAIADAGPYERAVLEDGVVTPQELEDARARKKQCMRDSGYIYEEHDDGTAEAKAAPGHRRDDDAGPVNSALAACSDRFGHSIDFLFNETRRNPLKEDEAKIMVACLRAAGVVDASYSERQWRRDNDTGDWPFSDFDPAAVQCRLDPLGLWREQ